MTGMRARIGAALGAGAFGQLVSMAIQVVSLPLFLGVWTKEQYGTWLMLSAVPAYFSMADVGMVAAAGNRMTMEVARGDVAAANRIFHSATVFMLWVCGGIAACVTLVLLSGRTGIDPDQAVAVWLLMGTVLLSLFSGLTEAAFKATGRYAQGTFWGNVLRLLEWSGTLFALATVGTFPAVAAGGCVARALGTLWVIRQSSRDAQGLRWGVDQANTQDVREIVTPALSFMAFPLANALTFQGGTLLVGHLLGPAWVAIFTAVRTLARLAVQTTAILAHALWAEITGLYARGQMAVLHQLYLRFAWLTAAGSAVLSLVLYFIGPDLLRIWSHGKIPFVASLMGVLLAYAAIGGSWHVPRVVLMACNKHVRLAPLSVLVSALWLGLGYALGRQWGIDGVACAMLVAELAMLLISVTLASDLFSRRQQSGAYAS